MPLPRQTTPLGLSVICVQPVSVVPLVLPLLPSTKSALVTVVLPV